MASAPQILGQYEQGTAQLQPFTIVAGRHIALSKFEEDSVCSAKTQLSLSDRTADDRCIQLAGIIQEYLKKADCTLDPYPELKSKLLLRLMELWVAMDQEALDVFPLLGDYHPVFTAEMLDVLQLLTLADMKRLQAIQTHIARRCASSSKSGFRTIFDEPSIHAFASRFFDSSSDLSRLHAQIKINADRLRSTKEEEFELLCKSYRKLKEQEAEAGCLYAYEMDEFGEQVYKHQWPCRKHILMKEAKRISIQVFEYPLPSFEPAAKAAVFELACPSTFGAYRDATWLILISQDYTRMDSLAHVSDVRKYSQLREYASKDSRANRISLGSATKSHLESHYATIGFPVQLHKVIRECGLYLKYHDSSEDTWSLREEQPSFRAQFPLKLPPNSPYSFIRCSCWPTSNRIMATQTNCPADLNIHEFTSWQGLLVGTHSRWLSLLRELGSTNLNFSADSTWSIVSRLVLEVGPASINDALRDVHAVFHDNMFCTKLLAQISHRLNTIRRNWREPIQMDTLLSMLLKVISLSSSTDVQESARELLVMMRKTTWNWCIDLASSAMEQSKEYSLFATWAAVLCKRTYHETLDVALSSGPEAVRCFLGASIALQTNLSGQFETLPYNLQITILQDLLHSYVARDRILAMILKYKNALLDAIDHVWPVPSDCAQADIAFDYIAGTFWLSLTLNSQESPVRHIHYNFIFGTLLINGQPMGNLPLKFRRWSIINELFGSQRLPTFPSSLPGMSVVLTHCAPYGHRIHLGFRDGTLVVQAQQSRALFELMPRDIWSTPYGFDLPGPLVDSCYHWLDLATGVMEIRRSDPWKHKPGNWSLNVRTRRATRRASTLVNPGCQLYKSVTQNFQYFESPRNIMVFKTPSGFVKVELKRLELDFLVRPSGLLECTQLGAVIVDSSGQDSGTWYGLRSQLIIRSVKNPSQRSVLVPTGELIYERRNQHVCILIRNNGNYLRYTINDVLGRLECPAEPRLLYTKALLHAYTSHFLPDRLCGRSGLEEALCLLRSGAYQPWSPLSPVSIDILSKIARLSPARCYYPSTLRCMETVHWNANLTTSIQDDRYRGLVESIFQRHSSLVTFSSTPALQSQPHCPAGNEHLEVRALSRIYAIDRSSDLVYQPRDRPLPSNGRDKVTNMSRSLSLWSARQFCRGNILTALQDFPVIGGYTRAFDKFQLSDRLAIDLGVEWGSLARLCLESSYEDRYPLMFLLSTVAFSENANMDLLQALVSYVVTEKLKEVTVPSSPSFTDFQGHQLPDIMLLTGVMKAAQIPFATNGRAEKIERGQLIFARLDHDKESQRLVQELARSIVLQWPSKDLNEDAFTKIDKTYVDVDAALSLVLPEWTRLTRNYELFNHIDLVRAISMPSLGEASGPSVEEARASQNHATSKALPRGEFYPTRISGTVIPTLTDLLHHDIFLPDPEHWRMHSFPTFNSAAVAVSLSLTDAGSRAPDPTSASSSPHVHDLQSIVSDLTESSSAVQRRYGHELQQSINALLDNISKPQSLLEPYNLTVLHGRIIAARENFLQILTQISTCLEQADCRARWLQHAGLWPRLTPVIVLAELRSTAANDLGKGVKEQLIHLGTALTAYQRLLRIEDAFKNNKRQQLLDETANPGHTNWSPLEYTDWLLLEIDGNMLLRREQIEVAHATIQLKSGNNSVLQLLMGKGKTSCILPMVALVLANGNHLCRIVVPRPLLLQSAQILQSRIGALLDRELIHVPITRRTPTNFETLKSYGQLHAHIKRHSGVILALPEHLLSFKLSGLQSLCDGRIEEASIMIEAQRWIERHARDVLDECDVSLAIKTQLIYPSGSQLNVDGHPLRWQAVEAILRLVRLYMPGIRHDFPYSVEIVERADGGYPLIYFLRNDAEDRLIAHLVDAICNGRTTIIPCAEYPEEQKKCLRAFISLPVVSSGLYTDVKTMFKGKSHWLKVAYLLRGLFVHRILLSTLKKRWNVQYGLHPHRDPMAVPFLAKGVPSLSAEWGHPDVAIILTTLSFYYQGLNVGQLKQAFEQLFKSDEPSIEYEKWATSDLPDRLRDYNAINVEDNFQLRVLHDHVRYNAFLIDFYLNNFVFPKHARQFKTKLQASGWDLVLYDPFLRKQQSSTTGFSGTNDSRHQLPMTIKQNDLPDLAHTNAEVLSYLLQERNKHYILAVDQYGKRLSEETFLEKLYNPLGVHKDALDIKHSTRILIDAGAQILEHDNFTLAEAWLKKDTQAAAAVYFDSDHKPWTLYRTGKQLPLVASPFAEDLARCLVYVDESHCRGTDLKLPPNARAALTLGTHLTKDALAQAAMRLRLLRRTQSVVFYSPPEVHQSILDLRKQEQSYRPTSSDVIRWLLEQTCNGIEQLEPLYYNQGINYLRQVQARANNSDFLDDKLQRTCYLSAIQTRELNTLKQLYEPKHLQQDTKHDPSHYHKHLRQHVVELQERKRNFQDRGIAVHSSALGS
ncbi:hypothetical protein K491DRAFT_427015 [Lophiostoma macrostomum CBS 122681]|uniref:ubiquitinyl hydrolase 1 n=1 Tax=Lophiostoma macrostomum CBS 122681 TaxID=1314788 RepID=A0A6A6T8Z7_9PLEO|nr:hypothetical protein K491DRAFT_427015 [Lophiostoma macrostomum CBS 122681]